MTGRKTGPKAPLTEGALDLSRLPASGGDRVIAFVEEFLHVPKGVGVRNLVVLRPWQREIVHALFDEPRPRQGLLSIPRGNGKTGLASFLAAYALYADEVESAQVLCVASDERQAGILFHAVRRMIELEPRLAEVTHAYKDRLVVPSTNSELRALPSDPGALQGWDPSFCVVDELHVVRDDTWEAMELAAGKRPTSTLLAISTPAGDTDGVMWRLVEQGREGSNPLMYLREFSAPPGCALDDEEAWAVANPALGDFLAIDALRSNRQTSREASFRRYRLGQWTIDLGGWLPPGAWEGCRLPDYVIPEGAPVVLGLDGSFSRDATAVVAVTIEETPHVELVGYWEPPANDPEFRIPVADVEECIRDACRRWEVREITADPFRWQRSLQELEAEGLPVSEFPQSPQRMTPATNRFYDAVTNGALTHAGDLMLTRHIGNARLREDSRGSRITKESPKSTRRIDAAVCAVMALERAASYLEVDYDVMDSIG